MKSSNQRSNSRYRTGIIVALVLTALTILEYFVGTHLPSATLLLLLGLIKAVLVVYFFMHVYLLWSKEGSH